MTNPSNASIDNLPLGLGGVRVTQLGRLYEEKVAELADIRQEEWSEGDVRFTSPVSWREKEVELALKDIQADLGRCRSSEIGNLRPSQVYAVFELARVWLMTMSPWSCHCRKAWFDRLSCNSCFSASSSRAC